MDYNQKNLKLYNVLIEVDDYISNLVTKVVSVPIRKNKKNLVGLKSREYEYNNFYDSINSEMILKQATDFEELDNSKYNKIMKYLSIMNSDHPWTVLRAKELKSWYDNGEYNRILNRNVNNQITNNQINYVQKFCTQCGSKLKPNAKFCTFCGERV